MEAFQYALQLFHSGGLVMYPLLLLSIFTLAIARRPRAGNGTGPMPTAGSFRRP